MRSSTVAWAFFFQAEDGNPDFCLAPGLRGGYKRPNEVRDAVVTSVTNGPIRSCIKNASVEPRPLIHIGGCRRPTL